MCQSFTDSKDRIIVFLAEQSTVGITFDQADYIVAEDTSITVTGRLTGLTGELLSNVSLTLSVDFSVDTFTGIQAI